MKVIWFAIFLILYNMYVTDDALTTDQELKKNFQEPCGLTGNTPDKPFPSLSQCYRYNSISCCSSVQDYYIKQALNDLLTNNCLTKYPGLTDLFCMFCSPFEPNFNNRNDTLSGNKRKIKVCKSFMNNLWSTSGTASLDEVSVFILLLAD
jgi:hypothetical protein